RWCRDPTHGRRAHPTAPLAYRPPEHRSESSNSAQQSLRTAEGLMTTRGTRPESYRVAASISTGRREHFWYHRKSPGITRALAVRERILEELTCSFFNPNNRNGDKFDVSRCPSGKHHAAINDGRPGLKVSRQTETMGSARSNAKTLKKSDKWRLTPESSAVEEN